MNQEKFQFYLGVILCLVAAALMFFDALNLSSRIIIGILGIIFIATAGYRLFKV